MIISLQFYFVLGRRYNRAIFHSSWLLNTTRWQAAFQQERLLNSDDADAGFPMSWLVAGVPLLANGVLSVCLGQIQRDMFQIQAILWQKQDN
jgi:hypothetical protein